MNTGQRKELFVRLRAANPTPTTELEYASTFQLLIAVILSAQATDKSVNAATVGLFKVAPDPASMLRLGLAGLKRHIRTIGNNQSTSQHQADVFIKADSGSLASKMTLHLSMPVWSCERSKPVRRQSALAASLTALVISARMEPALEALTAASTFKTT